MTSIHAVSANAHSVQRQKNSVKTARGLTTRARPCLCFAGVGQSPASGKEDFALKSRLVTNEELLCTC